MSPRKALHAIGSYGAPPRLTSNALLRRLFSAASPAVAVLPSWARSGGASAVIAGWALTAGAATHLKARGTAPLPVVNVGVVIVAVQHDAVGGARRPVHGRHHQVPGDAVSNPCSNGAAAEVPEVVGGVMESVQGGDVGVCELHEVGRGRRRGKGEVSEIW